MHVDWSAYDTAVKRPLSQSQKLRACSLWVHGVSCLWCCFGLQWGPAPNAAQLNVICDAGTLSCSNERDAPQPHCVLPDEAPHNACAAHIMWPGQTSCRHTLDVKHRCTLIHCPVIR